MFEATYACKHSSKLTHLGCPRPFAEVHGVSIDDPTLHSTMVVPPIGFTLYVVAIFTDSSSAWFR